MDLGLNLLGVPEPMDRGQRSRSSSSSSASRKNFGRKPSSRYNAPVDEDGDDVDKQSPKSSKPAKASKEYKFSNAYFNFMQDFRAQNAQKKLPAVEMARRGGEAWSRLTPEERRPYEAAAEVNRKRHHGKKKRGAGRVEKARKAAKKRKRKAHRDSSSDGSKSD